MTGVVAQANALRWLPHRAEPGLYVMFPPTEQAGYRLPPRTPKLTGLAAKRLEVAKSMGFNSVGRAVSDWARKRREAGEPVACFWKSVGPEHGGAVRTQVVTHQI